MGTSIVTVTGMSCGSCASKVKKAVGGVAGVTGVDADPATGRVTVDADSVVGLDAIRNAVEAAGYRVVA